MLQFYNSCLAVDFRLSKRMRVFFENLSNYCSQLAEKTLCSVINKELQYTKEHQIPLLKWLLHHIKQIFQIIWLHKNQQCAKLKRHWLANMKFAEHLGKLLFTIIVIEFIIIITFKIPLSGGDVLLWSLFTRSQHPKIETKCISSVDAFWTPPYQRHNPNKPQQTYILSANAFRSTSRQALI